MEGDKIEIQTITAGDGKNFPKAGQQATVHYVGTFPDSGDKFDSSRDKNKPFTFKVGAGQVIKAWDEVVPQLSLGQKVYFVAPYTKAYGERGFPGVIPPKASLAFEVELLSFK